MTDESGRSGEALKHIRVAVQALAYLVSYNEVLKQPSVFDHERQKALEFLRDWLPENQPRHPEAAGEKGLTKDQHAALRDVRERLEAIGGSQCEMTLATLNEAFPPAADTPAEGCATCKGQLRIPGVSSPLIDCPECCASPAPAAEAVSEELCYVHACFTRGCAACEAERLRRPAPAAPATTADDDDDETGCINCDKPWQEHPHAECAHYDDERK